ncbi:hypothetical protein ONZ45_g3284 [Pleurotus djamor]|nr:hypothetical protein ONZ45_g3284 [Pleurotus djamor]
MLRIRSSDFPESSRIAVDEEYQKKLDINEVVHPNDAAEPQAETMGKVSSVEWNEDEDTSIYNRSTTGTLRNVKPGSSAFTLAVMDEIFTYDSPSNATEYAASLVLKSLLFLPWCALVGGTIALSPQYLEHIAFHTGYTTAPRSGILRFAHWSEFAGVHILSFVLAVLALFWVDVFMALLVSCMLVGHIIRTWSDVQVNPETPLGEDDQQTIYILATKYYFNGFAVDMDILKAGSKYYARQESTPGGIPKTFKAE